MSKTESLHNIARVKPNPKVDRGTGGWLVRFTRKGKQVQVYVGDHTHGGKAGSLTVAIRERNRLETRLKPAKVIRAERLLDPKRGASLKSKVVTRNGRAYDYEYAEAVWSERPGQMTKRKFSVRKFGRRGALARAREARNKAIKKVLKLRP